MNANFPSESEVKGCESEEENVKEKNVSGSEKKNVRERNVTEIEVRERNLSREGFK